MYPETPVSPTPPIGSAALLQSTGKTLQKLTQGKGIADYYTGPGPSFFPLSCSCSFPPSSSPSLFSSPFIPSPLSSSLHLHSPLPFSTHVEISHFRRQRSVLPPQFLAVEFAGVQSVGDGEEMVLQRRPIRKRVKRGLQRIDQSARQAA